MFFISLTPSCLPLYHLAYVVVCSQAGIISPVQQILDLRCLEMMRLLENEATRLSLRLRDIARSPLSLSYLFNPTHIIIMIQEECWSEWAYSQKDPFPCPCPVHSSKLWQCVDCGGLDNDIHWQSGAAGTNCTL